MSTTRRARKRSHRRGMLQRVANVGADALAVVGVLAAGCSQQRGRDASLPPEFGGPPRPEPAHPDEPAGLSNGPLHEDPTGVVEGGEPPSALPTPPRAGQSPAANAREARQPYTDAQVAAFARAYLAVVRIQQQYQDALQNTDDPVQKQTLQMQAANDVALAIEEQDGISVHEFEALYSALSTEPRLRERVETAIRKLSE